VNPTSSPTPGNDAPTAIVSHLLNGAPLVGYLTLAADGSKVVNPVPITAADLPDLIADHLAGRLRPRTARTKDGREYTVRDAIGLAFPTVVRQADGTTTCISLSWDIDVGPGHKDGYEPEEGMRLLAEIAATCAANGLPSLTVTSRSGIGYHIHALIPRPIAAQVGVTVVEMIRDAVSGAGKVETFPAQANLGTDRQVGKWLLVPFGGYTDAPAGGRCIAADGTPVDPTFVTINEATLAAIEQACSRLHAEQWGIEQMEAAISRLKSAQAPDGNPQDYRDIGLQPIIDGFAEVVDDRGVESHIVRIKCPSHGGSCFHVAPDQGWFFCHRCRHAGGGPPAPFLLLRLLRPDLTPDRVHAELRRIRDELAKTSMPGGAA